MQKPPVARVSSSLYRTSLAAAVVALTCIGLGAALGAWITPLEFLQAFAAQIAGAALICAALTILVGMRRWALVAAALGLWQGSLLLPFVWPAPDRPAIDAPLHLLSINLWRENPDPQRTIEYLMRSGADVIGAVEATPEWRQRLAVLEAVYPYRVDCASSPVKCWTVLLSKHPILHSSSDPGEHGPPVVVWAQIDWQDEPLTIAAVQVSNPMIGLEHGRQSQLGDNLGRHVPQLPGDVVLMGDFNSTPWSTLQSDFRTQTGFNNRNRLAFTWPSWAPAAIRLPIDQIFIRGQLTVRNYRAGPAVGSDHLPLLADIYRLSP